MLKSAQSVHSLADSGHQRLVAENRAYIKTVCAVLRLTAIQLIAQFRGHDESDQSLNQGNFMAILKLVAEHDQWRRYTRSWQVKWPGENRNDLPDDLLAVSNEHFLDYEIIKPLAEHYRSNADDLSLELRQMKRMIERKTSEKTMPTFEGNKLVPFLIFVSKYEDAFFEMNRLLRIACTIPVTSVESKRSFSCLKLIKTHLRTTMVHERLSNLIILSMHTGRQS